MTHEGSATPDYTIGFSDEMLEYLKRFTADVKAAYLLPHLRPGLRILDFGCGPGAISAGLAKAIAPGELHGVDMEESQADLARSVAKANGLDNATFHVADVTKMPFEDSFFDVAHCHNVLMHIPDTDAALREVRRVLKPGGVIACREMIIGSSFTHPEFGVIRHAWEMFEDLLAADDGHPQMGRDLKNRIVEAGFDNTLATASIDTFCTPTDIEFVYRLIKGWFLSPEITEAAIKYGAATAKLRQEISDAYDEWRVHPGAFLGVAYGEVIANKPLP